MIVGLITLMLTSGFAAACAYINIVEQPARLALQPAALWAQWQVSYHRGTAMQLSLAVLSTVLAVVSYALTRDVRWLAGAGCLLAIAPYTLLVMMPVNRELSALTPGNLGDQVVPLVRSWGRRHAVRGLLGATAAVIFVWALS
ncbi:DUF1772 domain-containing protein [Lichenihabitans sp. Uapishka_5]|uniref:DUF1772 domain-containing protein n=1 Tax=Lichenihabitans sp. Uapishka_5 TaxID=3037302 RepID=UPI0029E7CD88|nr:DUF1772 domain-containing protein [Lichenihabitans sp. Uapishka_5]MDX7954031.1 DUF1772 domain-containing protein [Lichenihabitans sp. Uapishka_5]